METQQEIRRLAPHIRSRLRRKPTRLRKPSLGTRRLQRNPETPRRIHRIHPHAPSLPRNYTRILRVDETMARKSIVKRGRSEEASSRGSYWERFLASRNLIGLVSEEELEEVETQASETIRTGTERELSPDMFIFVYRVAERLTPLQGLDEDSRRRALKIREQFRRELTSVFVGNEDFNDWFSRTKTQLGLHLITFTKILYECLEGLKSQDARELRDEYGATIRRIGST